MQPFLSAQTFDIISIQKCILILIRTFGVYIQRDRLYIIHFLAINFPSNLIALSQKARVHHYETKLFRSNNHFEKHVSNDYI